MTAMVKSLNKTLKKAAKKQAVTMVPIFQIARRKERF
jgi:hypothetical protein